MKNNIRKILLALAVIAILIGAWFLAYRSHKSTSNLPQLSAIALMDGFLLATTAPSYLMSGVAQIQSFPGRIHGSG